MIEFKIELNSNPKANLSGYVNVEEIDDENTVVNQNWDDKHGSYYIGFPVNPISTGSHQSAFSKIYQDYETLINSYRNDELFLQYLCDFQDENGAEIDRGDYTIIINP